MCDCRTKIDADLAKRNARLAFGFTFTSKKMEVSPPLIWLEKIEPRGKKPPILMASHCPFCGERFPDASPDRDSREPSDASP